MHLPILVSWESWVIFIQLSSQSEVCPLGQLQDASVKSVTTFITETKDRIILASDMKLWACRGVKVESDFSKKLNKMLEEPLCDDEYEYYTDEDEEADIEDEAGDHLLDNDGWYLTSSGRGRHPEVLQLSPWRPGASQEGQRLEEEVWRGSHGYFADI